MSTKTTTILIAEDDAILQRMYQKKFMLEGYDVMVASDGFEALELLQQRCPDVMLLDIMMPVLDGLQVLERMRQEASTCRVPVVMLTNLSTVNKIARALELGAKGYVVKSEKTPFEVVEIVNDVVEEAKLLAREQERWPGTHL